MDRKILEYLAIAFINTFVVALTFVSTLVIKGVYGAVYGFIFHPFFLVFFGVFLIFHDKLNSFVEKIILLFVIIFSIYNMFLLILPLFLKISDVMRVIFFIVNLIVFFLALIKTIKQEIRYLILIVILTIYNIINIPCSSFSPNTLLIDYFLSE